MAKRQSTNKTKRDKTAIIVAKIGLIGGILTAVVAAIATIVVAYLQSHQPPRQSTTPTLSLQQVEYVGTVLDRYSTDPIENAEVAFQCQGPPSIVYTDAQGIYRLTISIQDNQSEVGGQVRIRADGYANYNRYISLSLDNPTIEDIRLDPLTLSPSVTAPRTLTPPTTGLPTFTPVPPVTPTSTLSPTLTATPTNISTAIPINTPTSTSTATSTPTPTPDFGGKLALSVTYGLYSKVYLTGFDGEGVNHPEDPVSLNAKHPMFSRDGESLIVNGTAGDTLGVFVADIQGHGPRVLIDYNTAYWPVFSPEGDEYMYVETTLDYKLHRGKIEGERWEVRANDRPILARNVLWSEDNRLVFQGCQSWLEERASICGIWMTDADNINPVRIARGLDGWPMDARHGLLAYMSAEDGDWDIYLIPLDGGKPQNITNNMNQDGLAAIAPDGRSVAYISDESGAWALWTVTLDTLEKRQWFVINPDRGTIDVTSWAGERMSWTR